MMCVWVYVCVYVCVCVCVYLCNMMERQMPYTYAGMCMYFCLYVRIQQKSEGVLMLYV
jgi:hypothetical protein